jgi:hypothetical protein
MLMEKGISRRGTRTISEFTAPSAASGAYGRMLL